MSRKINRRNLIIGLIIISLTSYKLLLAAQNFPTSFANWLLRAGLFICAGILLFFLKLKFKPKALLVLGYLILTYLFGFLNFWKTATENYLLKREKYFSAVVKELNHDSITCSLSLSPDSIAYRWTKRKNKPFILKAFQKSVLTLSENTGVHEIEKDKYVLLFIFYRFIDNGYGLAFIDAAALKQINKLNGYRINGLEITSLVKIKGNWYYLSFT